MGSLVKKGIVKGKRGRIKIKDQGNIAPTAAVWEKYQTEYYHDSRWRKREAEAGHG